MKKKILIVDDEKDTCEILTEILEDEGYDASYALSGRSALRKIKENKPDLVLLDIKMAGMDGIDTLEHIRKSEKDLAVVMMTAYGSLDSARKAMQLGALEYITKPFDIKLISSIVKDALSRK